MIPLETDSGQKSLTKSTILIGVNCHYVGVYMELYMTASGAAAAAASAWGV